MNMEVKFSETDVFVLVHRSGEEMHLTGALATEIHDVLEEALEELPEIDDEPPTTLIEEVHTVLAWIAARLPARLGPCRWFALCGRSATHLAHAPALGAVPCCERCAPRPPSYSERAVTQ